MNTTTNKEIVAKAGETVVVSVKNRVKQTLPEDQTYIYQPNRVTNAKYKSSLVSERLLTILQASLQEAVMQSMKGNNDYSQLSLFKDNYLTVEVPLKILTKSNTLKSSSSTDNKQYVYELCHSLMDLKIEFPFVSDDGKTQYRAIRHIVDGINIPGKGDIKDGKKYIPLMVTPHSGHGTLPVERPGSERANRILYCEISSRAGCSIT